jgi:hypothetical protein
MSVFILAVLLVAFIPNFLRPTRLGLGIGEIVFAIFLAAFLIYSIRVMIIQYRFFRKWGHRVERLSHLEEKLLEEDATTAPTS